MKLNRILFKSTANKVEEKHMITFKITRLGWAYFFTIGFFTVIKDCIKDKLGK